jgi:hypothetical protein
MAFLHCAMRHPWTTKQQMTQTIGLDTINWLFVATTKGLFLGH